MMTNILKKSDKILSQRLGEIPRRQQEGKLMTICYSKITEKNRIREVKQNPRASCFQSISQVSRICCYVYLFINRNIAKMIINTSLFSLLVSNKNVKLLTILSAFIPVSFIFQRTGDILCTPACGTSHVTAPIWTTDVFLEQLVYHVTQCYDPSHNS